MITPQYISNCADTSLLIHSRPLPAAIPLVRVTTAAALSAIWPRRKFLRAVTDSDMCIKTDVRITLSYTHDHVMLTLVYMRRLRRFETSGSDVIAITTSD